MTKKLGLYEGCFVELRTGARKGPLIRSESNLKGFLWSAIDDETYCWTDEGSFRIGAKSEFDIARILPAAPPKISNEPIKIAPKLGTETSPTDMILANVNKAVEAWHRLSDAVKDLGFHSGGYVGGGHGPHDFPPAIVNTDYVISNEQLARLATANVKLMKKEPDESVQKESDSENAEGGLSDFEAYRLRAKAALKTWLEGDRNGERNKTLRDWLTQHSCGKFMEISKTGEIHSLMTFLQIWHRMKVPVQSPVVGLQFWYDDTLYQVEGIAPASLSTYALCSIVKTRNESVQTEPVSEKVEGGQSDELLTLEEFRDASSFANQHAGSPDQCSKIIYQEISKILGAKRDRRIQELVEENQHAFASEVAGIEHCKKLCEERDHRIQELLEANNRYLERARAAETREHIWRTNINSTYGKIGRAVPDDEYETRADGQRVRKDRWQTGFYSIANILVGSQAEFEIDEIVDAVSWLANKIVVPDESILTESPSEKVEGGQSGYAAGLHADIIKWREEWLRENDPCNGTDCVTPFDKYLYVRPAQSDLEEAAASSTDNFVRGYDAGLQQGERDVSVTTRQAITKAHTVLKEYQRGAFPQSIDVHDAINAIEQAGLSASAGSRYTPADVDRGYVETLLMGAPLTMEEAEHIAVRRSGKSVPPKIVLQMALEEYHKSTGRQVAAVIVDLAEPLNFDGDEIDMPVADRGYDDDWSEFADRN